MIVDAAPRDPRHEREWREDTLPYLSIRLLRPRPICVLKNGKPRDTGDITPWAVEVTTGPASFAPATADPDRLRSMARALLDAADELEGHAFNAPRLPLGLAQ